MATLTTHLLEGTEVLREDDNGGQHVFTIRVDGISATAPKKRKLLDAVQAAGVPRMFEDHPYIADFAVRSREVQFIKGSPTAALVVITYDHISRMKFGFGVVPGLVPPTLSVDSTVQQVDTQFRLVNVDGKTETRERIILTKKFRKGFTGKKNAQGVLDPPEPVVGDAHRGGTITSVTPLFATGDTTEIPSGHDLIVEQPGSVSMQLPFHTVTYTRTESSSPGDKSKAYTGRINSDSVFGDPPHMWLCMKIGGSSRDNGKTYDVTYEFQRNPESWDPDAVFIDGETGQPVFGTKDDLIAEGALIENLQVLRSAKFKALQI